MTTYEKAEARRLPKKYRPLGAWKIFWLSVLYSIPALGWIAMIVHSISDRNINRRSLARFIVLMYILAVVLVAALYVLTTLGVVDPSLFEEITNQLPSDI